MLMKNLSIKETDAKLRSGELLPEDFASPNYDRFIHSGVIVHPNVYVSWGKMKSDTNLNITKLKKDITVEETAKLKHSFDTNGVDRTKCPLACNFVADSNGNFDIEAIKEQYYGMHREVLLRPDTAGWVFTPLTIPPELVRRVICGENENTYPQTFNGFRLLADNLILDIDDGYCTKDEDTITEYLIDAYPNRTNGHRKSILDIVRNHYKKSDVPIPPAKFIVLDTPAKISEWNTNGSTAPAMYAKSGCYDTNRKSYVYYSKGESGSLQGVICRMGGNVGRGMDMIDEDEQPLEPKKRKEELILHVGQVEFSKELLDARITALMNFDAEIKWMKQLGMDVSNFHIIGFIAQETGKEKGLIPVEEIRKHMTK